MKVRFTSKFKKSPLFTEFSTEVVKNENPEWIERLSDGAIVKSEPSREMIDQSIQERLIIELYSK
jgi:ribosomal protein S4